MNKPFTVPFQNIGLGDISSSGFPTKIVEVTYSKPVFAFWNIIAPTDLEAYTNQRPVGGTIEEAMLHKSDSWYDFNCREWGTKWDVAVSDENKYPETSLDTYENGENLVAVYHFDTAWSYPDEALIKLSSQYPDLLLTLSYEEETGWGGEHEYLRGKRLEGSEYNWKCRNCDYEESGEPPYCEECQYDMCPSCGYGEPEEFCQTHSVEYASNESGE